MRGSRGVSGRVATAGRRAVAVRRGVMDRFTRFGIDRAMSASPPVARLGPFAVDRAGVLHACDPSRPARFGFRWRGRRIQAELDAAARLRLWLVAGHVPFTAEAAAVRPRVFAAVAALQAAPAPAAGQCWRVTLTAAHGVRLEAVERLEAPPTATRLVAAATRFVLGLAPCLDLLEEAGARPG